MPSTRPWSSTPTARPVRESTVASSAARSESRPIWKVCPYGAIDSAPTAPPWPSRSETAIQPLGRWSPVVTSTQASPACWAAARAASTVVSSASTVPVARSSSPAEKKASRRMPRSKPRKFSTYSSAGAPRRSRDVVADLDRFFHVVGDQDHGLVQLGLEPDQLVLQGVADDGVDRAERLVHEQHRRVRGQGPGHADALLLAAGQLVGVAPGHVLVQADQVHQLAGPVPGLGLVPALEQRDGGDVVLDRAVREQPGLLDDVADAPPQPGGLGGGDVRAVEHDPALGRIDQPVDHAQAGGLAAATRADQDHGLPVGNLQVKTVDRYCSARITLCHALEGDQARASLIMGSGEISWTDHRFLPHTQPLTRLPA